MRRSSMALLSCILFCAIPLPVSAAASGHLRLPWPVDVALKRRQLAGQHSGIGFQKYGQRDLAWAARHFKEAVRLEPNNGAFHATLGGLYAARKQLKQAEAEFRIAARLEPYNTFYRERLGVVLERQDRPRAAAAVYKNVIWVNNKDAAAHQHLGWVFERMGKRADAIRAYRMALALDPENLPARARLMRLAPQHDERPAPKPHEDRLAQRPTAD